MSREPPHIQYEYVSRNEDACFGPFILFGGLGSIALVAAWGYIGPVFYTVIYVIDVMIHLFEPQWPVKWRGDSSTYTIVISGLTALALVYGAYRLARLAWRIVKFYKEG